MRAFEVGRPKRTYNKSTGSQSISTGRGVYTRKLHSKKYNFNLPANTHQI